MLDAVEGGGSSVPVSCGCIDTVADRSASAAVGCGFNRSMPHTKGCESGGLLVSSPLVVYCDHPRAVSGSSRISNPTFASGESTQR